METRRAKRLKTSFSVKLKLDLSSGQHFQVKDGSVEAGALDISTLGVGLMSKCFIPKGIVVDLELKINNKTIETRGEIRSAVSGGKGLTRLGIQFVGLDNSQKEIIDNFIKENERRSQPRLNLS